MGVTYKLKKEVVDFILQQKKTTPSLSCRHLTTIIQKHFHIAVSKSAVNIVLKTNRLSSPVGRQPKSKISNIFFIPQEKKDELRSQMALLLPTVFDKQEVKKPEDVVTHNGHNDLSVFSSEESLAIHDNGKDALFNASKVLDKGAVNNEASNSIMPTVSRSLVPFEPEKQSTYESVEVSNLGKISHIVEESSREEDPRRRLLPEKLVSTGFDQEVSAILEAPKCRVRTVWDDETVVENEQAIAVFLVASLWEMDKNRMLGHTLGKFLNDKGKKISVDLAEGVIVLQQLKNVPAHMRESIALSVADLIGFDLTELDDACKDIVNLLSTEKQAALFYESAWNTLSTEVACFELITLGGKRIYVDSLWTQVSLEPILEPRSGMLLFHAIDRLANEFINNVEPVIISMVDYKSIFLSDYFELLPLIVGLQNDYVDSVSILSVRGDRLVSFSRLAKILRGFIITGTFLDSDIERFDFEKIGDMHSFCSFLDGRVIDYHEGKILFGGDTVVQLFVFWDDGKENKRVVLTNLKETWVSYENSFIKNKSLIKNNKTLFFDKKFYKLSKNNNLYIKIKNNNFDQLEYLKSDITSINRKNIVNHNNQILRVICENAVL